MIDRAARRCWTRSSTGRSGPGSPADRPTVEELLAGSALRHDPEAQLDLIYNEIVLREELGEEPVRGRVRRPLPAPAARTSNCTSRSTAPSRRRSCSTRPRPRRGRRSRCRTVERAGSRRGRSLPDYEMLGQLGPGRHGGRLQGPAPPAAPRRRPEDVPARAGCRRPARSLRFRAEAEAIARLAAPQHRPDLRGRRAGRPAVPRPGAGRGGDAGQNGSSSSRSPRAPRRS